MLVPFGRPFSQTVRLLKFLEGRGKILPHQMEMCRIHCWTDQDSIYFLVKLSNSVGMVTICQSNLSLSTLTKSNMAETR